MPLFQFFQVRLRPASGACEVSSASFQFFQVRLRQAFGRIFVSCSLVSILSSTIKTVLRKYGYKQVEGFNSFKYD